MDIGIDLGTATIIVYERNKGIILKEPSVVAVNTHTGKVVSVGESAYKMIGRTPDRIRAIKPLSEGVISDYDTTQEMIKYFLKKVCNRSLTKPRVALCVPSAITEVESRAVVSAAISAGARKVYLIEEPVAAAIGAGIDITRPNGHIILDIGGGTSDIAVLSLNGIVCKTSVKVAGNNFDEAIIKYIRSEYNILIGESSAEMLKRAVGSVFDDDSEVTADVKGRNLFNGLPHKLTINRSEIREALLPVVENIIIALQSVIEKTPPELVGDIHTNGLLLTGGGGLLHGFKELIEKRTKIRAIIADEPENCVAIGTGKSFDYLDKLYDGFVARSAHDN